MVDFAQIPSWPSTIKELAKILVVDCDSSPSCHGKTQKQQRCRCRLSRQSASMASNLLDQILSQKTLKAARSLLSQLAHIVMCPRFHQNQASDRVTAWEKKLQELKRPSDVVVKIEDEDDEMELASDGDEVVETKPEIKSEAKPQAKIIKIEPNPIDNKIGAKPIHSTPVTFKLIAKPVTIGAQSVVTIEPKPETKIEEGTSTATTNAEVSKHPVPHTPRTLPSTSSPVPKSPSLKATQSTGRTHTFERYGSLRTPTARNQAIKTLLLRPLLKTEKQTGGVVYGFIDSRNYRDTSLYLKIGLTNNLERRKNEWARQCGYNPKVLMDFPADLYVKVEKLAHAHLHNQRMREVDCSCGFKHQEWFDVTPDAASGAVALWANWTRQEPYDEDGVLREEWRVRLEMMDLSDVDCWKVFVNGEVKKEELC
ncbi:hypothetical protein G7046_g7348 [Stylonectria norvegica]|nr:hypothetical protein G7046_g7348 [Stylonectria norvegica]